jgi:glycosyltransferase involved in cell wall biosynthesis
VKRLKAALRDISPAVVHTDFHTLPYALPACRDLGIPLIFTCWGWWFHPLPWQRRFYRTGPDAILGMSEAIRRGFLGNPPFMPSDRVRLLYPGVDTSVFRPSPGNREDVRRELDVPKDAPLVTLLARFQEVKGHELFLEAARLIARRFPAARFVIAGENVFGGAGDEALKRRVISTVRADPVLRERVKFLGWVERTERLLAASDVLVCSSRFESFGMSLVEAMASEVPVVSTRVGGPSEIVAHAETGYLVDPGRADQIAEHVLALLEDSDLRARMGRAARIRAVERFELRDYVEGFSQVLEAVVSAG